MHITKTDRSFFLEISIKKKSKVVSIRSNKWGTCASLLAINRNHWFLNDREFIFLL